MRHCDGPAVSRPQRRPLGPGAMLALVASVGVACSDAAPDNFPRIDSTTVASADVAPRVDPARTYEYDFSTVRVDSVLPALWIAGLPVVEAWLPLDYMCEDLRGARLTVALAQPDARMTDHDFRLGTGRLMCATTLRQYLMGAPPGSFRVDGTVRFIPVEGGCWALRVNDVVQYEPLGLPAAFREDGLEVRALLKLRDDLASICMVGRIAEVLDIKRR